MRVPTSKNILTVMWKEKKRAKMEDMQCIIVLYEDQIQAVRQNRGAKDKKQYYKTARQPQQFELHTTKKKQHVYVVRRQNGNVVHKTPSTFVKLRFENDVICCFRCFSFLHGYAVWRCNAN